MYIVVYIELRDLDLMDLISSNPLSLNLVLRDLGERYLIIPSPEV